MGVALLLGAPVAAEVQGLRRALGDKSIDRVPPHLTLVSPVNVRHEALPEALAVLREAAAGQRGELELELGPAASFLPASSVVYLAVGGPGLDQLAALHRAVNRGPLLRPPGWPWAPHVTVCDDASPGTIEAAVVALAAFRVNARFERVVLLEETDRRWASLADAELGPRVVVGRGGLDLAISRSQVLGPDAQAVIGSAPEGLRATELLSARDSRAELVLTGARQGRTVGVAMAWADAPPGGAVHVLVLVAPEHRGQGAGRALFRALEAALVDAGWALPRAWGHGPVAFFAACSAFGRDLLVP